MNIEVPDEYFDKEELENTPKRIKRFWKEWLENSSDFTFTTFDNPNYNQMITQIDIPFYSMCSHHLLPFVGKAHVAYVPGKKICGLSKIARVVDKFSHRPQLQERLTQQIADYLQEELQPEGVAVMMESEHFCMSMRGVKKIGSKAVTTALHGKFHEEPGVKEEFFQMVRGCK